jgi:hypothetical protein
MSAPTLIEFSPAITGDRWQPLASMGIQIGGVAPTFPLLRVRMQFRLAGVLGMTLDSEDVPDRDFTIIISSSENWLIHFPVVAPLPLTPGRWDWHMRFFSTESPNEPITYFMGGLIVQKSPTAY